MAGALKKIADEVIHCTACPRLREHCESVAREKKREFRDELYIGKPVPGFGDLNARVLIVGLAPAAHGGNRTGRMFTGDNSGLWLYRALYRAKFSNQEKSVSRDDGLILNDVFVTAVARCAPPQNILLPAEIENCRKFLISEMETLKKVQVYLVLGQVALKGLWKILPDKVKPSQKLPEFKHGATIRLLDGKLLVCSFHPSQQNTFTKKLTEPMFDQVFSKVRNALV